MYLCILSLSLSTGNGIVMITLSLRSTHLMINTFVHCCLSYAKMSLNVLMHFIPITIDWQWYCNDYFVIAQYPSHDKHIYALLFIISYHALKCNETFYHTSLSTSNGFAMITLSLRSTHLIHFVHCCLS